MTAIVGRPLRCGSGSRSCKECRLERVGRAPVSDLLDHEGVDWRGSFRAAVNVGDVSADPRYLTTLGTTRSEIIAPVFDRQGNVAGTIDVESENPMHSARKSKRCWKPVLA